MPAVAEFTQSRYAALIRAANADSFRQRFAEITPDLASALGMVSRTLSASGKISQGLIEKITTVATVLNSNEIKDPADGVKRSTDVLLELIDESRSGGVPFDRQQKVYIKESVFCLLKAAEMSLDSAIRAKVVNLARSANDAIKNDPPTR